MQCLITIMIPLMASGT